MRKIAFIGTGGTLAAMGSDRHDVLDYTASGQHLSADELISRSGLNGEIADIDPIPFRTFDSTAVTLADWITLAELCKAIADEGKHDGIVIGHGTATLEETAWCLSLVLGAVRVPVVVTGAMRPFSAVSSDGIANVAAACRVAMSDDARGAGVLVVVNNELFAPRDVIKSDTMKTSAFRAAEFGPMGYVDGEVIRWAHRRTAPQALLDFGIDDLKAMPRVDISYSHADADATATKAFVAAGARGIISAGFGPGMTTPRELEGLLVAVKNGVIVVQSSRVGAGKVVDSSDHKSKGIISAATLSPQKARILLGLCLARRDDHDRIAHTFAAA